MKRAEKANMIYEIASKELKSESLKFQIANRGGRGRKLISKNNG